MGADDDLHGFDEESLLRALRAPGSSSELADEERYVAAFRDFHTRGGRSRRGGRGSRRGGGAARRLGAGTALAVVVGVSGGGVAAAYSGGLPDPLQNFAHRVLGPVGAPPPADRDPQQRQSAAPRSPASPSPTPATPSPSASEPTPTLPASPTPNPGPSKGSEPSKGPSDRPSKDPSNTNSPEASPTPSPTATPTTTPEATPSTTATPSASPSLSSTPSPTTPPAPAPAKLTLQGGAVRVDVGQTTSFSGVVTAKDGSPIPGTKVTLQQSGSDGWSRLGVATSDEKGSVTFVSAPLTQTIVVRLRSAPVSSEPWRVVMRPLLTLSAEVAGSAQGSGESKVPIAISASAEGGRPGDLIRLLAQKGGESVLVGEGLLDANGAFQFRVTQSKRRMTYVVVLPQTEAHGPGRASIRVTLPDDDS